MLSITYWQIGSLGSRTFMTISNFSGDRNIEFIYISYGSSPVNQLTFKFKKRKMEKFRKLKEIVSNIEADATKFYDGANAAAGTRLRKAMQDLKALSQEIRTEVTEKKNAK
jgi:hypothetical protein